MYGISKRPVIAIDIDDTLSADFCQRWLEWYTFDSGHKLNSSDITDWDVSKFVLPSYKSKIYDYLEDKYASNIIFKTCTPEKYSIETTQWLQKYADIWLVTATHPFNLKSKAQWVQKHYPHIQLNKIVVLSNKSLFQADYMIDDKASTIENFNGTGLMFNRPWNKSSKYSLRVNNWNDIKSYFERELRKIEMQSAM